MIAKDGGFPSRTGKTTINVFVTDIIDSVPYFDPDVITVSILENTTINSKLFTVKAKDADERDHIFYNITYTSESNKFQINSTTGVVSMNSTFDRETVSVYTLKFQATDSAGYQTSSSGLTVTINILDTNDNPPVFTDLVCSKTIRENIPDKNIFLAVSAIDKDIGINAEVVYYLSSNVNKVSTNRSSERSYIKERKF